jgi:hypothetical protein
MKIIVAKDNKSLSTMSSFHWESIVSPQFTGLSMADHIPGHCVNKICFLHSQAIIVCRKNNNVLTAAVTVQRLKYFSPVGNTLSIYPF